MRQQKLNRKAACQCLAKSFQKKEKLGDKEHRSGKSSGWRTDPASRRSSRRPGFLGARTILMKAIHLTAYGDPAQNLMMVEVSEPDAPSGGEALVRMEYAPIDYSDLLLANGVYFLNPKLPSFIGGESAGIVEAIGPGG